MTEMWRPGDEEGPARTTAAAFSSGQFMTQVELEIGKALWAHARVKIPKDALVRVALDLAEHRSPEMRQKLSCVSYTEFYGKVGVPQ